MAKLLGEDSNHLIGEKPLKTLRIAQSARAILLDDYRRLPRSTEPIARDWEKWLKGTLPTMPVTFDQQAAAENPKAQLNILLSFILSCGRPQMHSKLSILMFAQ